MIVPCRRRVQPLSCGAVRQPSGVALNAIEPLPALRPTPKIEPLLSPPLNTNLPSGVANTPRPPQNTVHPRGVVHPAKPDPSLPTQKEELGCADSVLAVASRRTTDTAKKPRT